MYNDKKEKAQIGKAATTSQRGSEGENDKHMRKKKF